MAGPLFVGFDASTQGLTTQVIEADAHGGVQLVFESVINYDRDLPQFGTRHGVLPSDDPAVAVAPPTMWAEALDLAVAVHIGWPSPACEPRGGVRRRPT